MRSPLRGRRPRLRGLFAGTTAFARQMLSECRAAHMGWAIPVYVSLLLVTGYGLPFPDHVDRQRTLLEASVALDALIVLPIIALVAATTLSREFSSRVELSIAIKPASCAARIVGKWVALALAALGLVCIHATLGALIVAEALHRSDTSPAWSAPWDLRSGDAQVLRARGGGDRPMGLGETFTPASEDRPTWTFDATSGRQSGPARVVVALGLRQIGFTTGAGLVFVHARRGNGAPVSRRHDAFADRPFEVVVDPPGQGALSVMLTAAGTTEMYPDPTSVRIAVDRGSWIRSYALAHLGVLMAAWLAAAIALGFSATCSTPIATLYALVAIAGSAAIGPMASTAAVLADGDRSLALLEDSLASRGQDVATSAALEGPRARNAWVLLGAVLRIAVTVLPDLGRYDLIAPLVGGAAIDASRMAPGVRQLALYLPALLALAAAGLGWTGREGRR